METQKREKDRKEKPKKAEVAKEFDNLDKNETFGVQNAEEKI
jgi:hypothetical protein